MNKHRSLFPIYLTWALLSIFYAYQYFIRVSPSVMLSDLCAEFSLSAGQFALIPAIYLYAYGMLQIPMGFILDAVGIKKTMLASVIVSILGTVLFFTTHNLYIAYFARFLVGLGAAGTFIAPLKLVGDHLPQGKRGLLIGFTLTIGTLGALLAGKPQSILLESCHWRDAGLWSAVAGLIILLMMIIFIPKSEMIDTHKATVKSGSYIIKGIKSVLNNKPILIYGTLAFGLYAPLTVLSDTWGVSYLMDKYCLNKDVAAESISFIFIGLCIGSFAVPGYFERFNKVNQGIKVCIIFMCICLAAVLYMNNLSVGFLKFFLFFFGFFSGAEMLCFAGIAQSSLDGNRGLTLGVANTINMLGSAVLQQLTGKLLDVFWSGKVTSHGVRIYGSIDFEKALSVFFVIYIICIGMAFILKDEEASNA